jgi:hypothetical protein
MMPDIHLSQYHSATRSALASGLIPSTIRLPIDVQQALFEDDNAYCLDIVEPWAVRVSVNGYAVDYRVALTYERATSAALLL